MKTKLFTIVMVVLNLTIQAQEKYLFTPPASLGKITPIEFTYSKENNSNPELVEQQLILIGYVKLFFSKDSVSNLKMGNYIVSIKIAPDEGSRKLKISIIKKSKIYSGENSYVSLLGKVLSEDIKLKTDGKFKSFPTNNTGIYKYKLIESEEAQSLLIEELKEINKRFSLPNKDYVEIIKKREKNLKKLNIKKEILSL